MPRGRLLHAFRWVGRIPRSDVPLVHECLIDHVTRCPSERDKGKNVVYEINGVGTLQLSHRTGTLVVNSPYADALQRLRMWLPLTSWVRLIDTSKLLSVGGRVAKPIKGTVTVSMEVPVKNPGKIPLTITASERKGYLDIHIHVKLPSKGEYETNTFTASVPLSKGKTPRGIPSKIFPSSSIQRRKVTRAIIEFVREKGSICPKNARLFGLSPSSLYKRLERLRDQGILRRISKYPAVYELVETP